MDSDTPIVDLTRQQLVDLFGTVTVGDIKRIEAAGRERSMTAHPSRLAPTSSKHHVILSGQHNTLVEIEGDLREEFEMPEGESAAAVAFSDGTLVVIELDDDSYFRITPIFVAATTQLHILKADPGDGLDDYSDRMTLTSNNAFTWVTVGSTNAALSQSNPIDRRSPLTETGTD